MYDKSEMKIGCHHSYSLRDHLLFDDLRNGHTCFEVKLSSSTYRGQYNIQFDYDEEKF